MELQFERLGEDRWYVVSPEYEGDHEDLEMVEGADKKCAALSDDNMYVTLSIETERPDSGKYFTLEMEAHDE